MFLQSADNFTCRADSLRPFTVSPMFHQVANRTALARCAIGLSVFSACWRFVTKRGSHCTLELPPVLRLPNPSADPGASGMLKARLWFASTFDVPGSSSPCLDWWALARKMRSRARLGPPITVLRRSEFTAAPVVKSGGGSVYFNLTVESVCGRRSWPSGWPRYCARG
jgi:hypothetical protein